MCGGGGGGVSKQDARNPKTLAGRSASHIHRVDGQNLRHLGSRRAQGLEVKAAKLQFSQNFHRFIVGKGQEKIETPMRESLKS